MALAAWIRGDSRLAVDLLAVALEESWMVPSAFSVVSYTYVPAPTFRLHTKAFRNAIEQGKAPTFTFMHKPQLDLPAVD
jgi:hypothetical protein